MEIAKRLTMSRRGTKQIEVLFDDRFMESYTGPNLIKDPKVAIMELIANAWDAGATHVIITWPEMLGQKFSIMDNGHGMNDIEFKSRFAKLSYNRSSEQGVDAFIPEDNKRIITSRRPAFGRNGKGRFGAFAFGEHFFIKTWKDGYFHLYECKKGSANNLPNFSSIDSGEQESHGTEVFIDNAISPGISSEEIRREIGLRFLVDPNFDVELNGEHVSFEDIPDTHLTLLPVSVEGIGDVVVKVIDTQDADKTTQLHGIAWNVKNRLVGECSWKHSEIDEFIDGRREYAKRYVFIVSADCLEDVVMPDWTSFIPNNEKYNNVASCVFKAIKQHILELSKNNRTKVFNDIEIKNQQTLESIGYVSREKWETFIKTVQEECPSISDKDLTKLGDILANLEQTQTKYTLLKYLSEATIDQLDNLVQVFDKWNIDIAKIVLDEVEFRMTLLEKLKNRVLSENTDEVHELQPLFHRGLWIFGPEYETIEYTSNKGMTTVIQELFGCTDIKGSANRPDFAILPDSSVGFYGYDKYDDDGNEMGIDRLTIVELKRPRIQISDEQRDQAWKYVRELQNKGLIKNFTKVVCYVLGSEVDPLLGTRTENDGRVKIISLDYDTIIRRANSRLLKLYDKIKGAPFLKDTRTKELLNIKSGKLFR